MSLSFLYMCQCTNEMSTDQVDQKQEQSWRSVGYWLVQRVEEVQNKVLVLCSTYLNYSHARP